MEFIYAAFQYIANVFGSIYDFFVSIPDLIIEVFAYAWYWLIKLYLSIKISMVHMAYQVASMLLTDYEVYTVLNSAFNNLPPDLRHSAYQLGVVDAIRIVIDALATAFVLRIMGW
jgi:ABC-type phosphate transport system permease subunit